MTFTNRTMGLSGVAQEFFVRAMFLISAIVVFIYMVLPITNDVLRHSYIYVESTATKVRHQAPSGFILKNIDFDSIDNSLAALYFSGRKFQEGTSYRILYMPQSRLLLEAIEIP